MSQPYARQDLAPHDDPIQPAHDSAVPVVVIGAGLAGLTASAHLAQQGVMPLVLEADRSWAGGRLSGGESETLTHAGRSWSFTSEHGVHALWGGYHNMRALMERYTLTRLVPSAGETWMNRWGEHVRSIEAGNAVRSRYIPAPFHHLNLLFHPHIWSNIAPWDFLSLPGIVVSIFLTVGVDPIREGKVWDGLGMGEYFRGWTPNLKATFRGLGANLLAAHEDDIDLSAFIAALRFYTMLRRDAWAMSYLPADSHTCLIAPLMHAVQAQGGIIQQGMTAQSLERVHLEGCDLWRISVEDQSAGGVQRSLYAEHIILATYAPAAHRLLHAHPQTRPIAQTITFPDAVGCVVVRVWFKTSPHEGTVGGMMTGDFVPDNFFWLHRLYDEFSDWHAQTGGSAVELHLYGSDALLGQPDANLLILTTQELYRAFPELRGQFLHGAVRRNSKVHTRFRVPDATSLHVQTPYEHLWAAGDWIGHDTPSLWMERATVTGIAAANHVLSAYDRPTFDLLYPPPPEWLARALQATLITTRRALRGLRRPFQRTK